MPNARPKRRRRLFDNQRRRRNFRPTVSRGETSLGVILLLLLASVGAAVYVKGGSYDESLFALDADLLAEGEVLPAVSYGETPPASDSPASTATGILPVAAPPGWQAMGAVERFTPDNLYVKINGRAEQYLDFDVEGMESMTLVHADDSSRFLDIYVYDMGSRLNALGIFATERSPGDAAAYGTDGYSVGSSVFFRKGRYYTQLLGSDDDEATRAALAEIAEALDAAQPHEVAEESWADAAFPPDGLVADSSGYLSDDVFGLSFLSDVYTAAYESEGVEITCFLTKRDVREQAAELWVAYRAYINEFGSEETLEWDDIPVVAGDFGGFHDIVFTKSGYFGGVTNATDRALAVQFARALADNL